MGKIKGGYYIKARCIQNSAIASAPPHIREIWDWLLKESNHDNTQICDRGQCVRSYKEIQEGLKWFVGWRKHIYTKDQCETAMKWLKKHGMVTTRKTTRGMVVTVINYDKYQNPANYENHNSTFTRTTREPQTHHTINKNDKNEKNLYIYRDIINHLNKLCGSTYSPDSSKTQALINARLNEGYSLNDFLLVNTRKCEEWKNTDMAKYLRPETLYGTKFEGYLHQPISKRKDKNNAKQNTGNKITGSPSKYDGYGETIKV